MVINEDIVMQNEQKVGAFYFTTTKLMDYLLFPRRIMFLPKR